LVTGQLAKITLLSLPVLGGPFLDSSGGGFEEEIFKEETSKYGFLCSMGPRPGVLLALDVKSVQPAAYSPWTPEILGVRHHPERTEEKPLFNLLRTLDTSH
jgi:hypothetical protein